jgi:hypothetical protein
MMPPYCPGSAPPGEQAVYRGLASAAGTDDWIALHSLAIANHVRQVEGEADFVVVVPDHGVLVIEVKSHRSVQFRDDGRWRLGTQPPTSRSPFQQASEAKHSIREYLERRGVDLTAVPLLHCVWFTHVRARTMLPDSPSWHDWELLDQSDLPAPAAAVLRVLSAGTEHLATKLARFRYQQLGPTAVTAQRIAKLLRPRFELATTSGDMRRYRTAELSAFIEEQYDALDAMQDNQQVLFTGPAGSGKTFLAVEAARRDATDGRTGRLLCFNQYLGKHLRTLMQGISGVSTSTFHQELVRLTGLRPPPGAGQGFWDCELPERALEVLLAGHEEPGDFLVVDELQDLAREPYLDVLDLMVKDGLNSGRILLFGDFERQAIFESGDGRAAVRARCPDLSSYRLQVNCRNLPRIGTVVNTFSKLEPGYRRYRRHDDGIDPQFMTYERGTDQSPVLLDAVRMLREEGFDLDETMVLSPLREGSTVQLIADGWLRQILQPTDGGTPVPGKLRYSTIHAFKGLEAPAVVLTDLDANVTPNFESLVYIGMSRATDRLVVIIETETLRAALGGPK